MGDSSGDGATTAPEPAFEERQSMPSWFGSALGALSVPALVVAIAAIVEAEGLTGESVALLAAVAVSVLGPIPLLARATLRTTVSDDGIAFRFAPFHRSDRTVRLDEIEEVRRGERRAYRYGLQRTRWGWEYRPNSTVGVEIYRENGPPIFLGSKRPHELRTAIEAGVGRHRSE